MRSITALLILVLSAYGCRKQPDPVPPVIDNHTSGDGHLKVVFENMVGSQPLQLNTGTYTNEAGNQFSVSIYKYYISNVKLWRADSSFFAESESYHLINEEQSASRSFTIHDVPAGDYVGISFLVGVDSARNTSGAQTGALDPGNAMFWDWNTGYIMSKIEGTSPQSGAVGKEIIFHMGGFSGQYSVLRTISLVLPVSAKVQEAKPPEIHIQSDVLEWFKTPKTIDFSVDYFVTNAGKDASAVADNYSDMFTVDHVEN